MWKLEALEALHSADGTFHAFVTGPGKFVHANGDVFVGHWKNNAAHGIGKLGP